MLQRINFTYLIVSIFFYSIFIFINNVEYPLITSLNILNVFMYALVLYITSNMNKKYYNKKYLVLLILLYVGIFIVLNNMVSYYYANDFWVFSKADALFYHNEVLKILSMPLDRAIYSYLTHMGTDDLGMILILYPIYHLVESNLILNFLYLFVGLFSALSIFNISSHFMTKKYAYLSSIAYSLSSFVIYFHSNGLKESFLVMLILLSFDFYYKYIKNKNPIFLLLSIFFISSIILFRPAIAAMLIVSIGLSSLLSKKGGIGMKIFSLFIVIFLVSISSIIISIIERYSSGGFDMLIYARESQGMIIGSLSFTYSVNILAQLVGPLPTLISEKTMLTFFAPGLIYRVFISFPFWFGIIYIYKTKAYKLYPLMLFVLMEMSALALLLEGLELRKSLPHIGIVFIIAFWFMDKYNSKNIVFKKKKRFELFFYFFIIILTSLIVFWNFK